MHLTQLNMDFELEKNETSIYLLFLTFVRWEIPAKSVFLPNISKLAHGSWASGSCLVEPMFGRVLPTHTMQSIPFQSEVNKGRMQKQNDKMR